MLQISPTSLFFDNIAAPPDCNFNKSEAQEYLLFYQFYKIFKSTGFVKNLQKTASVIIFGL